jgi:hypothetical protein
MDALLMRARALLGSLDTSCAPVVERILAEVSSLIEETEARCREPIVHVAVTEMTRKYLELYERVSRRGWGTRLLRSSPGARCVRRVPGDLAPRRAPTRAMAQSFISSEGSRIAWCCEDKCVRCGSIGNGR